MYIFYKITYIKVLTTEKNWQHRHIQEHDDTTVAETKVKELLCTIKPHVIIRASDKKY